MTSGPTRKSLEEIEDARMIAEKLTVLAQPHRLGDRSDMTDPLGMFVRMHLTHFVEGRWVCQRECYDAGWEYFSLVRRWRRMRGVANPDRIEEISLKGMGPLAGETEAQWQERIGKIVKDWERQIRRCENTMKCSGLPGFNAAQRLLLFPFDFPEPRLVPPVKCAITNLAIELGKFSY